MPKRKADEPVENEESSSEDSDAEARKKLAKKEAKKKQGEAKSGKTEDGDCMFEIGKKKYVCVRKFKGNVLVDIREYYEDNAGNLKPGKKGIALQVDQWEALKGCVKEIDEAINEIN